MKYAAKRKVEQVREPPKERIAQKDKRKNIFLFRSDKNVAPMPSVDQQPSAPPPLIKEILHLLIKIAVVCLAFVLLFTFMFGICRYSDASMSPAIKDGDLVFFYRLDKSYVSQSVILLQFEGEIQVRRVVATAGDTVDITPDGLAINGALQQEPNIRSVTQRYETGVDFPLTVGEGQVFVLGDSRRDAADSRVYGVVQVKDTLGKVITIFRRRDI